MGYGIGNPYPGTNPTPSAPKNPLGTLYSGAQGAYDAALGVSGATGATSAPPSTDPNSYTDAQKRAYAKAAGRFFGPTIGSSVGQTLGTTPRSQAPATPPPGTQSGPGILENWFNQRASGTDPGYEYALGRGVSDINNQYAARGGYNSGAAVRSISDYEANMGAQRESQLDALAGGASGEHQGRLNSMFSNGLGIANGTAGVTLPYDTAAGGAMSDANMQSIEMSLARAGVDQKTIQSIIDSVIGATKAGASIAGSSGGKPASG